MLHLRHRAPTLELDDIQAVILRARPAPYFGTHALLEITDPADGREALRRLRQRITSAARWDEPLAAWTAVALTYPGLQALEVPEPSLQSFPAAFREGMAARADRLRDDGPNHPSRWQKPFGTGRVHLAVSVIARTEPAWREEARRYEEKLAHLPGLTVLLRQDFGAQPDSRNPFGYKDASPNRWSKAAAPKGGPATDARSRRASSFSARTPRAGFLSGCRHQRSSVGTAATWSSASTTPTSPPSTNSCHRGADNPDGRELLAAKLVGRWRSGAPLALAPDRDDADLGADDSRNNDFTYKPDPRGLRTPPGCHIRRMNPRDSELAVMADVNIRRLIRRSTSYGPPLGDDVLSDDGRHRGLDFIAIGARAIDTVEFLQSEWVNSGNFISRGTEKDPMLGVQPSDAYFTVPGTPPRRIGGIETFNTLDGGEYFFLPSLTALDWLAAR